MDANQRLQRLAASGNLRRPKLQELRREALKAIIYRTCYTRTRTVYLLGLTETRVQPRKAPAPAPGYHQSKYGHLLARHRWHRERRGRRDRKKRDEGSRERQRRQVDETRKLALCRRVGRHHLARPPAPPCVRPHSRAFFWTR